MSKSTNKYNSKDGKAKPAKDVGQLQQGATKSTKTSTIKPSKKGK